MEGFGNSSLYCNFNPPEKKKAHSERTPKKSPRTPKKITSPDPTVKSQIFSQDLIDHESDLNLREEEFLIELKLFYEGIDKYNKYKAEYEEMLENKKNGRFSLIGFASRLSMYQDMLEQRFDAAQLALSDPIDDVAREERLVQQLEHEVNRLQKELPEEVPPEAQINIDLMLKDAERINEENERMLELLRKRKASNEIERRKLIDEQIHLESLESDERRLNEQLQRDQEKLARTPKIDEEQAIREEKFRSELEQRRKETQQRQLQFDQKCKISESELFKLQKEVQNLQSDQYQLSEKKRNVDRTLLEIKMLIDNKENFDSNLSKAEDEINSLKRKMETQSGELEKIKAKRENLKKKAEEAEARRKQLSLKEEELKRRRLEIESANSQFALSREELQRLGKAVEELENETRKYQKLAGDMHAKLKEAQEEMNEKIDDFGVSSDSKQLEQIKNALNSDS